MESWRYNFLDDACRYTTLDKQEYVPVRPQISVGVSTNSNYPWFGDVHPTYNNNHEFMAHAACYYFEYRA